jgi:hypothetical protein
MVVKLAELLDDFTVLRNDLMVRSRTTSRTGEAEKNDATHARDLQHDAIGVDHRHLGPEGSRLCSRRPVFAVDGHAVPSVGSMSCVTMPRRPTSGW